ncbi:MAG: hypothetical protein ACREQL_07160 [Candidatus Binatia bacterium]
MRLWPFSSSASESDAKLRGTSGRTLPSLASVTPFNSSDTKVNGMSSLP